MNLPEKAHDATRGSMTFDLDWINRLVLGKQHLTDRSKINDPATIAEDITGLHATISTTPYLSLFARSRRFEKSDLDEELFQKRTLGRIRCVRKTIYIHSRKLIPMVYAATAGVAKKASRRYLESRGVAAAAYDDISGAILGLLEGTGMTASSIRKKLHTDLDVSAILYLMCDQGLLIRWRSEKGWRDRSQQYRLFREVFPEVNLRRMGEAEATALLAGRYLRAFGPATVNDIAWWTGLGKTKARSALNHLQDQILHVRITGMESDFVMLRSDVDGVSGPEPAGESAISLLPTLDPYLMGYKDRARYIDPEHYSMVFDRSGNATSTIVIDGKVAGVWDFEGCDTPVVKLFLFRDIEPDVIERIRVEAHGAGKFISEHEVRLELCRSMKPLTKRTAGGMMSPLKDC